MKVKGTKLGEPISLFEELKDFIQDRGPNGIVNRFMTNVGKEMVKAEKKAVFMAKFFGLDEDR